MEYVEWDERERMYGVVVDDDEKVEQDGVEESSSSQPSATESVEDTPSSNCLMVSTPLESEFLVDAEDSMVDTTVDIPIANSFSSAPTPIPATTVTWPSVEESAVGSHSDNLAAAVLEEFSGFVHFTQSLHSESAGLPTFLYLHISD